MTLDNRQACLSRCYNVGLQVAFRPAAGQKSAQARPLYFINVLVITIICTLICLASKDSPS